MSLPIYAEYKDSGVEWLGLVPAHWSMKRLRTVAELNPSKSEISAFDRETEVSFLPMEAIGDDGALSLDRTRPIRDVESGYTYFRDGDVALAKITPCFENGKGALMQGLQQGVGFGTTELIVARPRLTQTSGEYLNWIFRSPGFRKQGEASMYGAGGQKRVPDDFVRNLSWAFPPMPEQAAISAFLDRETAKIDALIAEQEKLIVLLAEKRQATISHAVTRGLNPAATMKDSGVAWLGEVPAHWEVRRLGTLTSKIGSGKTPSGGADVYGDVGVMFLRSQNIYDEGLMLDDVVFISESIDEEMAGTRVKGGDILLNITGASLGRTCLVPDEFTRANVNQHVCIVRLAELEFRAFVSLALKSSPIKAQIDATQNGAAREGLNFEQIGKLALPLPPACEQREIEMFVATELNKLDALSTESARATALLKERRSALIAAAVTGQIDVRQTM